MKNEIDEAVRSEAIVNLKDQSVLAELAKYDKGTDVRKNAIRKLTDVAALEWIIENRNDIYELIGSRNCSVAYRRLQELTGRR